MPEDVTTCALCGSTRSAPFDRRAFRGRPVTNRSGKGFKFYDYFSALGKEQMPFYFSGEENLPALLDVAKTVDSSTVQAVQEKLDLAFRRFQQMVRHE